MSGRGQALTRSRCPACGTVFRVTSEQLRLKAGKVRCGHCQSVFNAFDHLLVADDAPAAAEPLAAGSANPPEPPLAESVPPLPEEHVAENSPKFTVDVPEMQEMPPAEAIPAAALPPELPDEPPPAAMPAVDADVDVAPAALTPVGPLPEPLPETPEESTLAAREAGLVAVRELADSQAYNRWSAGPLASDGLGGFDDGSHAAPLWPYLLVFVLLLLGLAGQLAHHYRTEVVLRLPAAADAYAALGIAVPLPRDAALVSIETSDLQFDSGRGLFVLNATLRNRARHAQAWPSLELTLTDVNDRVVARRIIAAADYLASAPPPEFPSGSDIPVRLWIEASGIGAAGYRLYIFYP